MFFFFSFLDGQSTSVKGENESIDTREEPDGEETINKNSLSQRSKSFIPTGTTATGNNCASVKVPNWISSDTSLEVVFNDRATSQIEEFQINRVSFFRSLPLIYLKASEGNYYYSLKYLT